MNKGIYMTEREVVRAETFAKISEGGLSQAAAAKALDLSVRQVQRLYKSYKEQGIKAVISKMRGKPSNRRLPAVLLARVRELITCEVYADFGPTLMSEKLEERHQIKISRETLRGLMIREETWNPKNKKRPVIHQQRQRRTRFGELLQIDGSPHAWFEDRGERCVLLVFIDDATGLTYGKFFKTETSEGYMITAREYITKYGKPLSMYSDKHSIFRINKPGCNRRENFTQFGRALEELEIKLICANTPQAKGRVERVNQTLQDRLVKEMRLVNICTIEEGNRFLETFWDDFNKKFSVAPTSPEDAHRSISEVIDLNKILCEKHHRKVSKNLELQFEGAIYQLDGRKPSAGLVGAYVTIIKTIDNQIVFEYRGQELLFRKYAEQIANGKELSSKEIDAFMEEERTEKRPRKPSWNHPWKGGGGSRGRRKTPNLSFC